MKLRTIEFVVDQNKDAFQKKIDKVMAPIALEPCDVCGSKLGVAEAFGSYLPFEFCIECGTSYGITGYLYHYVIQHIVEFIYDERPPIYIVPRYLPDGRRLSFFERLRIYYSYKRGKV